MAAVLGGKNSMARSGRTLRRIPGQPTRGSMPAYKGQFMIIKKRFMSLSPSHSLDFEKMVQDGGLEAQRVDTRWQLDPIMYSMNKRKRWLLPDMLAETISDEELHKDSDYQVVMVERDIPCYKGKVSDLNVATASCKAVHRTKSMGAACRKATANYSYEADLTRNPETVRNRRRELAERRRERAKTGRRIPVSSRRNRRQAAEQEQWLPQLQYEVLRPGPMHHRMLDLRWRRYDIVKPWKSIKDKRNLARREDAFIECRRYDDPSEEDIYQDFDVEEEWPLHTTHEDEVSVKHPEDSPTFDLGSFIKGSKSTKSSRRNCKETHELAVPNDPSTTSTSMVRKKYGKGCAIYRPDLAAPDLPKVDSKSDISDGDSGFESDSSPSAQDDHTVSWLDLGHVARDFIQPNRLRMDFGQEYVEGCSSPRRFAINMKAVSANKVPVAASAVFTTEDMRQHGDLVSLRLRCCSADFPVQGLHQVIKESISSPPLDMVSLVEQMTKAISCHASLVERLEQSICKAKKPEVTLENTGGMMGWSFDYSTVEHVKAELDDEEAVCEQHLHSYDLPAPEVSQEDSCGICFESLAPSGGDGEEKGTALHGCGHLFCNECWVHHVTNRVLMNEIKIHCPAFKCESVVDKTTLLSILPDTLTHIHLTRLHDNRISAHPQWRWCPNSKCGRLVKVPELDRNGRKPPGREASQKLLGVPVPCECGVVWCSECEEAAHWPATCKQAAEHLEHVKDTGVDDVKSDRITSVEVKRCPSCQYPIEKNGGCMHMICGRCGFDYCWECLAAWSDHDWTTWQFKCPQSKETFETVFLSQKRQRSVSFTELAVKNRKMRTHELVLRHHEQALRLAKRMFFVPGAATHAQHVDSDLCSSVNGVPEDQIPWSFSSNQADQSKLMALLDTATKMAAFAAEVRMLLEYMSVLLGLSPRKMLSRKSGWKSMILRLMFIARRMELLFESHQDRSAEDVWESLRFLFRQGQLCIRDITKTVPLLHQRLQNVKGHGSKSTVGSVKQRSGPALV